MHGMVSPLQQQKTHTATCLAQVTDLNILKFQSPFENKILTVHISLSQIYQHQSGGTRIKQSKWTCGEIEGDGDLVLVLGPCEGAFEPGAGWRRSCERRLDARPACARGGRGGGGERRRAGARGGGGAGGERRPAREHGGGSGGSARLREVVRPATGGAERGGLRAEEGVEGWGAQQAAVGGDAGGGGHKEEGASRKNERVAERGQAAAGDMAPRSVPHQRHVKSRAGTSAPPRCR